MEKEENEMTEVSGGSWVDGGRKESGGEKRRGGRRDKELAFGEVGVGKKNPMGDS